MEGTDKLKLGKVVTSNSISKVTRLGKLLINIEIMWRVAKWTKAL